MSANPQGRLDVLILRLADELGTRIQARTQMDIREALKDTADQLIDDMGIPRVSLSANDVVRKLLNVPDRSSGARKLRRVV